MEISRQGIDTGGQDKLSQQSDSSLKQHPEIGLRNKTKHAPHKLSPCLPRVKAGFVTLCTSRRRLSPTACNAVGTSFRCRLGIRPLSRSCLFRAISVALIPFFVNLIIYPQEAGLGLSSSVPHRDMRLSLYFFFFVSFIQPSLLSTLGVRILLLFILANPNISLYVFNLNFSEIKL